MAIGSTPTSGGVGITPVPIEASGTTSSVGITGSVGGVVVATMGGVLVATGGVVVAPTPTGVGGPRHLSGAEQ